MTLQDFISTLKTSDIRVSIFSVADTDAELIRFYSEGYAGVDDLLLARTVKRWEIESQSAIKIIVEEAVQPQPEPDQETQPEPENTEPENTEPTEPEGQNTEPENTEAENTEP